MKRATEHKPRAYSTLRTVATWRNGKLEYEQQLVWVYPEDKPPGKAPSLRSRLETDDEVRARLKALGKSYIPDLSLKGDKLDYWLANHYLTTDEEGRRKIVEEFA